MQKILNKLKGLKRASNLVGENGNEILNQIRVEFETGRAFYSYGDLICVVLLNGKGGVNIHLTRMWDYSQTTTKYLGVFLGGKTKKEIVKAIESKGYKLIKY